MLNPTNLTNCQEQHEYFRDRIAEKRRCQYDCRQEFRRDHCRMVEGGKDLANRIRTTGDLHQWYRREFKVFDHTCH